MKLILTAVLMNFAVIASLFGQDKNPKDAEQTVAQMERDFFKALGSGDGKTIERVLADDLSDVDDSGVVGTKQQILQRFTPGAGVAFEILEMKPRVYDNAAVVVGTAIVKFRQGDKEQSEYFRYSNTYVKGKNGWQMVSTQQRSIPVWLARKMEDGELKPLTASECAAEAGLKSLNYDVGAYIKFNNTSSEPVAVHWLNYEGKRDSNPDQRQTIEPGKSGYRATYLTHPFVVTDARGKCLGIYRPEREPGLVIIK